MKKILLAIAIVLTIGLTASAQRGFDGFFSDYDNGLDEDRLSSGTPKMPTTPLGNPSNATAPLGTGLLIMTALGVGYAVARKKK